MADPAVILSPDTSVEGLRQENARLRTLVTHGKEGLISPPPSPPLDAQKMPAAVIAPLSDASSMTQAFAALAIDPTNPLYSVVELMKAQLMAQAKAQEDLLTHLGDLRSSHASLQASACEVTDEVACLREKAAALTEQVEAERARRAKAEEETTSEAEKVTTLRQKMEESRRAIMRLQEEAASRRNADSRRGSNATLLGTPTSSLLGSGLLGNRRGSRTNTPTCSAVPPARRMSLMSGMDNAPPVPPMPSSHARRASMADLGSSVDFKRDFIKDANRRASVAFDKRRGSMPFPNTAEPEVIESPASIGLGLEFEGAEPSLNPPPDVPRSYSGSARRRSSARTSLAARRGSTLSTVLTSDEETAGESNDKPTALVYNEDGNPRPTNRRHVRLSLDSGDARQLQPPRSASFAMGMPYKPSTTDSAAEKAEIAILKAQLAAAKEKLEHTEEAREASETCLKALKDFMSAPGNASTVISLPPLPTDATDDTVEGAAINPESVARRPSLWGLPAFLSKMELSQPVPAMPEQFAKTAAPKGSPSPVLTAFNGWSARRRASVVPGKDKSPSGSPRLASAGESTFGTFGSFSFQSRTRNPALMDSPPSPGGGWSPGGTSRPMSGVPVRASPNGDTLGALASPPFASLADGVLARNTGVARRPGLPTIESYVSTASS